MNTMIDLNDDDHRHLTTMIYAILDAITGRMVSREEAMAAFAHVITAAAIGNEGELRGWLKPETVARWIRDRASDEDTQMQPQPYDLVPDFERRLDELIRAALAINADPWRITAVLDIRADRTRMKACAMRPIEDPSRHPPS